MSNMIKDKVTPQKTFVYQLKRPSPEDSISPKIRTSGVPSSKSEPRGYQVQNPNLGGAKFVFLGKNGKGAKNNCVR